MILGKLVVIFFGSLFFFVLLGGNVLGIDGSDVIFEIFYKFIN